MPFVSTELFISISSHPTVRVFAEDMMYILTFQKMTNFDSKDFFFFFIEYLITLIFCIKG